MTTTTEAAELAELKAMFAELREELAVLRARMDASADEIRTQRIVVGPDVDEHETDIRPSFRSELLEQVVELIKRGAGGDLASIHGRRAGRWQ